MKTGFKSLISAELSAKLSRLVFIALLIALPHSGVAIAAPSLSDEEARAVVEISFNRSVGILLLMGKLTVVREGRLNVASGIIPEVDYQELKDWERAGFVSIAADQGYESYNKGGNFTWDQFYQQSQQGIVAKITVAPTESGKGFVRQMADGAQRQYLNIPEGTFVVTKVVKNEERKRGVDDFRLIMVSYTADWSPAYKRYKEVTGRSTANSRKAIVLLKWDAFENKWKRVATDLAEANQEFSTGNVTKMIGQ